jgi:hypothetical protein
MGAKTWMLVSAEGNPRDMLARVPALDRDETLRLASRLFPAKQLVELDDGDLSLTNPDDDEVFAGSFPGVAVVAAAEFGIDYPSRLPAHFLQAMPYGTVVLHAMHSVVDWFAYAIWKDGQLVRSLSLSPDSGILEDIGARLPFEEPFRAGERRLDDDEGEDDYPFVFHPLELGEAALATLFGYVLEGVAADAAFDAEDVALMTFRRKRKRSR